MDINKKIARIVGVLYIVGTAAGFLSAIVVPPVINAPDYLIKVIENKTYSNVVIALGNYWSNIISSLPNNIYV